jgi:hypothetical protein
LGLRRGLGGRAPYELEIKCQGRPSDSEGRAEGTDCKLVVIVTVAKVTGEVLFLSIRTGILTLLDLLTNFVDYVTRRVLQG